MGTPTDIEEFVNLHISKLSKGVRGIMGDELGNIPRKSTILDVGCGIGNILYALYSNGYKNLYGFDIEKELINAAKKIIPRAHLFIGNAENIPLKSEYFDYCTCYDLLEHIKKPHIVLKEINGVLKPNGTLYITVANGYSINDILFRLGGRILRGRSSHIQKFKKWEVKKMLIDNGFKIEESREIKGCPLVDFPIVDKIPFSNIFKIFGHNIGNYMDVAWEFKALKGIEDEN